MLTYGSRSPEKDRECALLGLTFLGAAGTGAHQRLPPFNSKQGTHRPLSGWKKSPIGSLKPPTPVPLKSPPCGTCCGLS